jgi:hypothetical protein
MVHCVSQGRTLSKSSLQLISNLINLPCLAGGLFSREAGRTLQKLKIVLEALFRVVEDDANRVAHSAPHAADTVP